MKHYCRTALLCFLMLLTGICLLTACGGGKTPTVTEPDTDTPTSPATDPGTEGSTDPETAPETTTPTEPVTDPVTEPDTTPAEDPSLNVFPTDGKNVEIGIFWEPPVTLDTVENYNVEEQYDWIRDAHISFIEMVNPNAQPTLAAQQQILELARARGIGISWMPGKDGANLLAMSQDKLDEYLAQLASDDAIVGVHIVDEPTNPWAFANACRSTTKAGLTPRLNFLPYFATWVFENYQGHIEDTIAAVGKENFGYLSYDQYPFPYDGSAPSGMYYNLNLIREIGLKYGIDTAFYIQSIGEHGNFRRTTGDEIRFHVNAGLAYGIKSYTYFTWWTTGYCAPADYAIISPYGEKTDIYDAVADVNLKTQTVGPLLRRLDALEIYHVGGNEPGVTNLRADGAVIYPKGKSRTKVIVSFMEDRETGRDYIMLVNKNYKKEISDTFLLSDAITHLYDCSNGAYEELDITNGTVDLTFEPGGFVLLAVGQHDNIVDRKLDADAQNLARNKSVAVSAVNPGSGWYAYCVTDGLRDESNGLTKGYRSASEAGWIEVDLDRVTTINRVDIYPTGNGYSLGQNFPTAFSVMVSTDREHWTTVASFTDYQGAKEAIPSFTFDALDARYVRIDVTAGTGGGFEIAEIEIYYDDGSVPAPDNSQYKHVGGEPAGTNVALNRPTTCSTQVPGWDPSRVVDGDSSMWSSNIKLHNTPDAVEWVAVDLAIPYTIDYLILKPRQNDEYFPEVIEIQVSDDGVTYTTVKTLEYRDKQSGDHDIRVDIDGDVTGRYVRLKATRLTDLSGFGDGYLFQLRELEVYNK